MIGNGHRPSDVWEYSPRQIVGYLYFANKRQRQNLANGLMIARAAQASNQDVKRIIDSLTK